MPTGAAESNAGGGGNTCQTPISQIEIAWAQLKSEIEELKQENLELRYESLELHSENEQLRGRLNRIQAGEASRLRQILSELETPIDSRKRKRHQVEDVAEACDTLQHSGSRSGSAGSAIHTPFEPLLGSAEVASVASGAHSSLAEVKSSRSAQDVGNPLPLFHTFEWLQRVRRSACSDQVYSPDRVRLQRPQSNCTHAHARLEASQRAEAPSSLPDTLVRYLSTPMAAHQDVALQKLLQLGEDNARRGVEAFPGDAVSKSLALSRQDHEIDYHQPGHHALRAPPAVGPSTPAPTNLPIGFSSDRMQLAPNSPPSISVRLLRDSWQYTTSPPSEASKIPDAVRGSIAVLVQTAHSRHGDKHWLSRVRSAVHCVSTALHQSPTFWVKGRERQLCCRTCFNKNRACVVIDRGSAIFTVLPLPPSLRPAYATPDDDAYFVNADRSANSTSIKHAPWSTEPLKKRVEAGKKL